MCPVYSRSALGTRRADLGFWRIVGAIESDVSHVDQMLDAPALRV